MFLLNKDQVDLIKNNKTCLIKNFTLIEDVYNFDFISALLEENDLHVSQKTSIGNLKDVFQIIKVSNTQRKFKDIFYFLYKIFKYEKNQKDEVDLFFSLVSQVGNSHIDEEDVFIIGLQGVTIYRVFNTEFTDYQIEKGDMIFIPKGIKHKVIGLTPRIIASIGFYGNKSI